MRQGIFRNWHHVDFRIVPDSILKGVDYNGQVSESELADALTAEKGEGRDNALNVIDRFYYGTRHWSNPTRLKADLLGLIVDAKMPSREKKKLSRMLTEGDTRYLIPSSYGSIHPEGRGAAFELAPGQNPFLVLAVGGYVRQIAIAK